MSVRISVPTGIRRFRRNSLKIRSDSIVRMILMGIRGTELSKIFSYFIKQKITRLTYLSSDRKSDFEIANPLGNSNPSLSIIVS